jgi:hypothetical protein
MPAWRDFPNSTSDRIYGEKRVRFFFVKGKNFSLFINRCTQPSSTSVVIQLMDHIKLIKNHPLKNTRP